MVIVRSQGAMRSYGVGFDVAGRLTVFKNLNGYKAMASKLFDWEYGKEYKITVNVAGNVITAGIDGETITWACLLYTSAALAEGQSEAEAILFANIASSIAVTRKGAQESLPIREEVAVIM